MHYWRIITYIHSRQKHSTQLKALANGFNIHSILLNALERLLNVLDGGMGKRFQHFIQQNLESGLVITFRPQLFAHMQEGHFEMTQ